MRKTLAIAAALAALTGYASLAWAKCPPGTAYNCYTTANGKQSCGCR